MVQHTNVHQRQGRLQAVCNSAVSLAWLSHTGRMIVGENYGCGIIMQYLLDHFPRMHACTVNGAKKQFFILDQTMLIIEIQAGEDFSLNGRSDIGGYYPDQ